MIDAIPFIACNQKIAMGRGAVIEMNHNAFAFCSLDRWKEIAISCDNHGVRNLVLGSK
jgi:hypothetical protein